MAVGGDSAGGTLAAARELAGALRLVGSGQGWVPPVTTCSGLHGAGVAELWEKVRASPGAVWAGAQGLYDDLPDLSAAAYGRGAGWLGGLWDQAFGEDAAADVVGPAGEGAGKGGLGRRAGLAVPRGQRGGVIDVRQAVAARGPHRVDQRRAQPRAVRRREQRRELDAAAHAVTTADLLRVPAVAAMMDSLCRAAGEMAPEQVVTARDAGHPTTDDLAEHFGG